MACSCVRTLSITARFPGGYPVFTDDFSRTAGRHIPRLERLFLSLPGPAPTPHHLSPFLRHLQNLQWMDVQYLGADDRSQAIGPVLSDSLRRLTIGPRSPRSQEYSPGRELLTLRHLAHIQWPSLRHLDIPHVHPDVSPLLASYGANLDTLSITLLNLGAADPLALTGIAPRLQTLQIYLPATLLHARGAIFRVSHPSVRTLALLPPYSRSMHSTRTVSPRMVRRTVIRVLQQLRNCEYVRLCAFLSILTPPSGRLPTLSQIQIPACSFFATLLEPLWFTTIQRVFQSQAIEVLIV